MARIEIRRAHKLGKDRAKAAVQQVAEELQSSLGARHQWQGDGLKFDCTGADGSIDVTDSEVRVLASLSWLLTPAKGKIEREISAYLDRYLKATA